MLPICFLFSWLILGLSLSDVEFAYAAVLEDPNGALNATYDFIIVGGQLCIAFPRFRFNPQFSSWHRRKCGGKSTY